MDIVAIAADGGTSACWRIFGDLGLDAGVDWRAVQTAVAKGVSAEARERCKCSSDDYCISRAALVALTMRLGRL